MKLLRASLAIAGKDLRIYFRDRTGLLLGFGLPVVLVLAFGFTFKMTFGGEDGMTRATLWVVDLDQSAASGAFVERLRAAGTLRVRPEKGAAAKSPDQLRALIADGEAHHALLVNEGFAAALAERRFPRLTLVRDPGREMEDQMVSIGLMQSFIGGQSAEWAPLLTARALELGGLPPQWSDRALAVAETISSTVEALFRQADDEGMLAGAAAGAGGGAGGGPDFARVMNDLVPVERVDVAPPKRPKQLSYMLAQNISGMSVMMLMFGLVACGTLLLHERDEGTLQRLLMTRVPRSSLLWGKFLFTAAIGACQLAVTFAVGGLIFRVNLLRDPATLLVLSAALVFSVTAFGILIAAFARTTKQAEGLSTIIILVMSAVGGAWFPVQMFELPAAGVVATRATLTWWAMSGFQGMLWYGKSWTDSGMLLDVTVLVAFGLAAAAVAALLFKRRFVNG